MLTLNCSTSTKKLKTSKSSKTQTFKGNLKDCTVKKIDLYSIKANCPIQGSTKTESSWVDFDFCFKNDDGQLIHRPFDTRGTNPLKDNCEHFYSLVDEVTVYYKNKWGKTKSKTETKDGPYYINGYCDKNNGKQGWSNLDVYDYVYYKEDGTISCN
jgi:hypothetical protein